MRRIRVGQHSRVRLVCRCGREAAVLPLDVGRSRTGQVVLGIVFRDRSFLAEKVFRRPKRKPGVRKERHTTVQINEVISTDEYPLLERNAEYGMLVRGTLVTALEVVARVLRGSTWSDVLRDFPEITEDDLRECLRYAVQEYPSLSRDSGVSDEEDD